MFKSGTAQSKDFQLGRRGFRIIARMLFDFVGQIMIC